MFSDLEARLGSMQELTRLAPVAILAQRSSAIIRRPSNAMRRQRPRTTFGQIDIVRLIPHLADYLATAFVNRTSPRSPAVR